MAVSIAFRFVAGRYHATPFGHHVNEGLIEWPPSPWRLLRALLSVGYTSGIWSGDDAPPDFANSLIKSLAEELPGYCLPPIIGTHTRHYMPVGVLDGKRGIEKTTLVFDTWARIEQPEHQPLIATWPDTVLGPAERQMLGRLVNQLNYLGRSESWVQASVLAEDETVPESNCVPEGRDGSPERGYEQVSLLAPQSASDYNTWREKQLEEALKEFRLSSARKPSKTLLNKRMKAVQPYPDDLLDCLQKDTNWLRAHGWSQPPGSRRTFYWRPGNTLSVRGTPPKPRAAAASVQAVLLSLTNASRNDHALPSVTRALAQAELLHQTLVGIAARRTGSAPAVLTGRDDSGKPLAGAHEHTHILPLDLDQDGHLDHMLIWAPMGLGARSQAAIRAARRTYQKGGVEPLRLAVAGMGEMGDFASLPGQYGESVRKILGPGSYWQSATPFVPGRYLKKRGKNTLQGQVLAELRSRRFPGPVAVHQLAPSRGAAAAAQLVAEPWGGESDWRHFRHFVLSRHPGRPQPPVPLGFAIGLEFSKPVEGPLAIGYGSHYGLGLFQRAEY